VFVALFGLGLLWLITKTIHFNRGVSMVIEAEDKKSTNSEVINQTNA
jgi:hypothetical protein